MSTGHIWVPPEDVRRAGELVTGITYRAGEELPPGVQRNPPPSVQAFAAWILKQVKGVSSVGMVRPSSRRNGGRDPHLNGYACDIMIGGNDPVVGDAVANWLMVHAKAIGLQYVLWAKTEWTAHGSRGRWGVGTYPGENPHRDHVHVELSVEARAVSAEVMRARLESALAETWGTLALPLVTVAGLLVWVALTGGFSA